MTTYDLAFSMGFSCGGTMALRAAKMQFASYPLDWIGAPGIVKSARMIESEFANWFEKDDLQFVAVRGGSFNNNVYQNRKTRFGYPHDFSRLVRFDEVYPEVAEKYARRVKRFLSDVRKSSSALVVYVERPINPCESDETLAEAKRILETKFPNCTFDLVYFHLDEKQSAYEVREVAPGITSVTCNYATYDWGEISHKVKECVLARFLSEHFGVVDTRTEEEKARYASESKRAKKKRVSVGGNALERKISELQYRLYRKLEKILQVKNLVARDYPLWFE